MAAAAVTARKVALGGATAMVGAMASPDNQANQVASTELQTHRWLLSRRRTCRLLGSVDNARRLEKGSRPILFMSYDRSVVR